MTSNEGKMDTTPTPVVPHGATNLSPLSSPPAQHTEDASVTIVNVGSATWEWTDWLGLVAVLVGVAFLITVIAALR